MLFVEGVVELGLVPLLVLLEGPVELGFVPLVVLLPGVVEFGLVALPAVVFVALPDVVEFGLVPFVLEEDEFDVVVFVDAEVLGFVPLVELLAGVVELGLVALPEPEVLELVPFVVTFEDGLVVLEVEFVDAVVLLFVVLEVLFWVELVFVVLLDVPF